MVSIAVTASWMRMGWRSLHGFRSSSFRVLTSIQSSHFSSSPSLCLNHTPLHSFNETHGGKMVDFCGWEMPVSYKDMTVTQSVAHTRTHASLFDVSHMMQFEVHGDDRAAFMESLTVGDFTSLSEGSAALSLFTNSNGGIMDDTVIANAGDHLYAVANCCCAEKDLMNIRKHLKSFNGNARINVIEGSTLLALQGPEAVDVLAPLVKGADISTLGFMRGVHNVSVSGVPNCRVTRCGYTGEDGFEIAIPAGPDCGTKVAEALLDDERTALAGLGARDALRLEAALCLYGNDMDENTTPVEAGLIWTIPKARRASGGFPGSEFVQQHIREGAKKFRVGIIVDRAPARMGAKVFDATGEKEIGKITSGMPSPTLKKNIAMAFVNEKLKPNSAVKVEVRSKLYDGLVTKMPFVPHQYKRA